MTDDPDAEMAGDADTDDGSPNADADAAEPEDDGLANGDFVRLGYSIRTVENETLVDTTDEETAEEEGLDVEDRGFGPRTVVLGEGHVFEAVEEAIIGGEIGDTGTVEVPAVDAFGEHDPDAVETVSTEKIPEDERYPGAHVEIDGRHGHVETIIGGRARMDFNHPLAGEDLEYEYEVVDVVEDRLERAQGLLGLYLDVDLELSIDTEEEEEPVFDDDGEEEGTETVEYETLYIESVPQLAMNQQWMFQKQQIADDLMERIDVDRVVVREVLDGGGPMGGMMGGLGGGDVGAEELEAAIDEADLDDLDADEVLDELETDAGDAAPADEGDGTPADEGDAAPPDESDATETDEADGVETDG